MKFKGCELMLLRHYKGDEKVTFKITLVMLDKVTFGEHLVPLKCLIKVI